MSHSKSNINTLMSKTSNKRKGTFDITEDEMERVKKMTMSTTSLNKINLRAQEIKFKEE
jgi:hypothetical protein